MWRIATSLTKEIALGIWIALGILAALIAIVLLFIVGIYNKLVVLKNRFLNAFAQFKTDITCQFYICAKIASGVFKNF